MINRVLQQITRDIQLVPPMCVSFGASASLLQFDLQSKRSLGVTPIELYAIALERALLLYGFYGKEVNLFSSALLKSNIADADAKEKETLKKGLKGVLDGAYIACYGADAHGYGVPDW